MTKNYGEFKDELLKDPEVRKEYDLIKKQEEIRLKLFMLTAAEIPQLLHDRVSVGEINDIAHKIADLILAYLHSQGVVIKVERELPGTFVPIVENPPPLENGELRKLAEGIRMEAITDMLKWHNDSLEPLIEEIK